MTARREPSSPTTPESDPDPSSPDHRRRGAPTSTAAFGSGRRESHDATAFYDRFTPPITSDDSTIARAATVDVVHNADARDMSSVESNSVALVVTSPPYFAGKAYEEELGVGGVPADYFEYLDMLRDVFAECARVLEPGGRIAVNVANLGRRPYRSLSGDVTTILGDLGLLLRGEVVWWKGRAAGGSCAWGTFQSPANPVLRDVTERIVMASKGRFDRAVSRTERAERGLPSDITIGREEFMEATTDLWELLPESATRVGHPAPFPVSLPTRLIDLYTYRDDVVLDPFMGSGTTAVAAVATGRHFIGFETDPSYVEITARRVAEERERLATADGSTRRVLLRVDPADPAAVAGTDPRADPSTNPVPARPAVPTVADVMARTSVLIGEGRRMIDIAADLLQACGFRDVGTGFKPRGTGVVVDLFATAADGRTWVFDVSGSFTATRAGLRRTDDLWKAIAYAAVLEQISQPLVLLTTDAPAKGTPGYRALAAVTGPDRPVFDVIEITDADDLERLVRIGRGVITPH